MKSVLTSTSNPLFHSQPFNSIENNYFIDFNQFLFHFQSFILFYNNIIHKLNSHSTKQKSIQSNEEKEKESLSSSYKMKVNLKEIDSLMGTGNEHLLLIQLKELNGFIQQTNIFILSHLFLNDLLIIDLNDKCIYQNILYKNEQRKDLLQIDLSLYNYSNKLITKPKDCQSYLKGFIQKINFIFLFKYYYFLSSLINSFSNQQQKEDQIGISLLLNKILMKNILFK